MIIEGRELAKMRALSGGSGGGGGGDNPLDALIDGSITEVTSNVTNVKSYAFYDCSKLTSVSLPKATSIGGMAFQRRTKLVNLYIPNAKEIGSQSIQSCEILPSLDLPNAEKLGYMAIAQCHKLTSLRLPLVTSVDDSFYACSKLEVIDFTALKSIGTNTNIYSLVALIFRGNTVCTATSSNVLKGCYHYHGTVNSVYNPDGLKDGYIYVPRALIEDYKAATNWVTFATQFRALEDYTVDGTITGELDWNKVNKVVINFTIDGTSYQADEGMTWTEWCGSSYNTAGYVASSSDQSVIAPSGNSILDASWSVVNKSATITNGHAYASYNADSGGAN